jgi:hypothetical protein
MKQGVLTNGRVALLMKPGDKCFRGYGRRNGERRRKSVRGCIVSPDLSVLNLVIVKKGEAHVPLCCCPVAQNTCCEPSKGEGELSSGNFCMWQCLYCSMAV